MFKELEEARQPNPNAVRDIKEATLEIKTFVNKHGKIVKFRLLKGWPDQPDGTVSIFEEKEPIGDSKEVTGIEWPNDYSSPEDAWDAVRKKGFSEIT